MKKEMQKFKQILVVLCPYVILGGILIILEYITKEISTFSFIKKCFSVMDINIKDFPSPSNAISENFAIETIFYLLVTIIFTSSLFRLVFGESTKENKLCLAIITPLNKLYDTLNYAMLGMLLGGAILLLILQFYNLSLMFFVCSLFPIFWIIFVKIFARFTINDTISDNHLFLKIFKKRSIAVRIEAFFFLSLPVVLLFVIPLIKKVKSI